MFKQCPNFRFSYFKASLTVETVFVKMFTHATIESGHHLINTHIMSNQSNHTLNQTLMQWTELIVQLASIFNRITDLLKVTLQ